MYTYIFVTVDKLMKLKGELLVWISNKLQLSKGNEYTAVYIESGATWTFDG